MTYLITNRHWVDLSDFVAPQGLWDKQIQVAESIARSVHFTMPCIVGARGNLLVDDVELGDLAASPEITETYKAQVSNMNVAQLYTFTKFIRPAADLAMLLPIRKTNGYSVKHLAAQTGSTPITQHWTWFIHWIGTLDVFKEVGRISCFINERGQSTLPHRDYPDGVSRRDQFLFFTHPRKKFWVLDGEEKHYLTSPVSTFDNANYHGSDAPSYPTWSIRVDGVFNESFLDRSGLTNHYR